jgi:hypothetical protein
MKTLLVLLAVSALCSTTFASTYNCKTADESVTGQFHFTNGQADDGSLFVNGNEFDDGQFQLSDYNEVPGQSFYLQLVLTNGDSYMFQAQFTDPSVKFNGTLNVFSSSPMSSSPLICTYAAH